MKKVGFVLISFIILSLAWMGFVREPLPDVPGICGDLSGEVGLDFSINTMDHTGVELGLNNKVGGKGLFVQFRMNNAWKTGRPGLVLAGMKGNSDFRNGMSPQAYLDAPGRQQKQGKDFSDFMKDKSGKAVSTYSFNQKLVEGNGGKTFMQMSYDGPAMEMIQTLEIPRPVTVPAHISQQFTSEGIIQFQPGTVAFDRQINGFYIPVVVR